MGAQWVSRQLYCTWLELFKYDLYSTSSLLYYQIKAKMSKEYLKRRRREKKQSRPHITFSLLSKAEKKNRKPKIT